MCARAEKIRGLIKLRNILQRTVPVRNPLSYRNKHRTRLVRSHNTGTSKCSRAEMRQKRTEQSSTHTLFSFYEIIHGTYISRHIRLPIKRNRYGRRGPRINLRTEMKLTRQHQFKQAIFIQNVS